MELIQELEPTWLGDPRPTLPIYSRKAEVDYLVVQCRGFGVRLPKEVPVLESDPITTMAATIELKNPYRAFTPVRKWREPLLQSKLSCFATAKYEAASVHVPQTKSSTNIGIQSQVARCQLYESHKLCETVGEICPSMQRMVASPLIGGFPGNLMPTPGPKSKAKILNRKFCVDAFSQAGFSRKQLNQIFGRLSR